jgi:RNA polymerase sigma-70 factor (ECF subfamily)
MKRLAMADIDEIAEMAGKDNRFSALQLSRAMPDAYKELRNLARRYMARERRGIQTLQATALVHEAYLRLAHENVRAWRNRAHFCAIAACAMREILVEKARARAAKKRGGSRARVSLEEGALAEREQSFDLLMLHEAMEKLHAQDPKLERVVELRFFGGLTIEETAEIMETSPVSVKRSWSMARAWLRKEMETDCAS